MLYTLTLAAHNITRWIVLILAIYALYRVFAGLFGKVHQYGATFENRYPVFLVDNRGHAIVRCNFQEIRRKLLAGTDLHWNCVVGETTLFEHNRYLVAIRRRPVVKINHASEYNGNDGNASRHV